MQKIEKLAPDTSVIIEGILSKKLESKEVVADVILIHEAILKELEHQANLNKEIGYIGLDEIMKIKEIAKKQNIKIEFSGRKPGAAEIKYAKLGEIDSMIRDLAFETSSTLMTADKTQALIAEAKDIPVIFIEIEKTREKLKIESFFDETTMSVHLKELMHPFAKKGEPGKWQFVQIKKEKLNREQVREIAKEIVEEANIRHDAFIEIERPGSTIVQLGTYRIVITKPPFADGWEITAVRPVKRLILKEYNMTEKLNKRIAEQAEGILIAGAPGHGKTTFAQALAEYYVSTDKIVKTVEAPRDLVLPDEVTQYAISHGTPQEIHDILLLSRPDYTIFDEMRNTEDFRLFADLRLSGVGMVGVVHATNPIDAIQRFIGRIELGVIPQIIDTVVFIKDGQISKVFSIKMTVKVPCGMTEADLARPVVVVTDFETGNLEFEIYSYGEETVVVPVVKREKSPAEKLAANTIKNELQRYADHVEVEMLNANKCIVKVPKFDIARIIGKQGKNIERIEGRLGVRIDVQELDVKEKIGKNITFDTVITKKSVEVILDEKMENKDVDIYINKEYLLTVNVGKKGTIKIKKLNKIGKTLVNAIKHKDRIEVLA